MPMVHVDTGEWKIVTPRTPAPTARRLRPLRAKLWYAFAGVALVGVIFFTVNIALGASGPNAWLPKDVRDVLVIVLGVGADLIGTALIVESIAAGSLGGVVAGMETATARLTQAHHDLQAANAATAQARADLVAVAAELARPQSEAEAESLVAGGSRRRRRRTRSTGFSPGQPDGGVDPGAIAAVRQISDRIRS